MGGSCAGCVRKANGSGEKEERQCGNGYGSGGSWREGGLEGTGKGRIGCVLGRVGSGRAGPGPGTIQGWCPHYIEHGAKDEGGAEEGEDRACPAQEGKEGCVMRTEQSEMAVEGR